ncbi:GumC family protein [Lyngbya confervoides]|uniref:CobQ/CobB/MinD/ParA nucleotide binding domain-containing protein n=1 Tax=Lyngbya confervoides BDU141951 TaxID=1574623 RepID=A0ABD4T7C4_9CYAN|nr:tyrosine-protein kinase domain-containing protein [Lyngbya confervoides]MCM1984666.1 hypothetical protein [Lyngbya confervoides BDU141951]
MGSEQEFSALSEGKNAFSAEYLGLERESLQSRASSSRSPVSLPLRFIRRNILLLLLPALAFGGAALILALRTPARYVGEFQILVEPVTSPESLLAPQPEEQAPQTPFDYETLTRLLVSPKVLDSAISAIRSRGVDVSSQDLQQNLEVERLGRSGQNSQPDQATKLVGVTYESPDPQAIEVVLDELAKRYLKYGEEERSNSLGGGVEFIEKQLPEVRQRVNVLEAQLQQLQQQYRISDLDAEGAALATRAREIEAQRQQIQPALQAKQQLKQSLEQQLNLTPSQVIAASQVSENPNIQAFSSQLQQVEAQLSIKSASLTDGHPELVALQEQRRNLETALRREVQKAVGSNLPRNAAPNQPQSALQRSLGEQLISTINEIQVLRIQNQALNQASTAIDQQLRQFPAVKRQASDLQAKLATDRTLLNQLLLQREEFRVKAAQKGVPWQIVSKPALLRDAEGDLISTADRGWYKVGLATLGGLLLGLGAALLKEKRQDIFYGLEDLQDQVALNLCGILPFDRELSQLSGASLPSELDEEALYRYDYPRRLQKSAEQIYVNLKSMMDEQPSHSLVVGSVMEGDGKSTLALHLAKAVAAMGQRVLLVDANLNAPHLHSRFGLPNYQGLSDILVENIDPNQLIQRSPLHSDLFLLTAGHMSRKATKLLASNQMKYLMDQLHHMFDLVVYDTYSLQNSSGASFLALNARGLLLVVGLQKTRRSRVLKMLKQLESSRIPVMGLVANFVRGSAATEMEGDWHEGPAYLTLGPEEDDEFEIFRVSDS